MGVYFKNKETGKYLLRDSRNRIDVVDNYLIATLFTHKDATKFMKAHVPKKERNNWIKIQESDVIAEYNKQEKSKEINKVYDALDKLNKHIKTDDITMSTISDVKLEEIEKPIISTTDAVKQKEIQYILDNMPEGVEYLNFETDIADNDISRKLFMQLKSTPFNSLDFDWVTYLNQFDKFIRDINNYRHNLPILEQIVFNKQQDLNHHIELHNLDAPKGFKAYKYLQKQFQIRRKIKNEKFIVSLLFRDWITHHKSINVIKAIEKIPEQKYMPRCLNNLFEEHEIQ